MKYIRTKNGRIVDVGAFIENEKTSKYYKDHIFDEIENRDGKCYLHWTAVGTEENDIAGQKGVRCDFGACIDSPFIKQGDTIEELCDEFVIIPIDQNKKPITHFIRHINEPLNPFVNDSHIIYGAIWTRRGLIYVAKLNVDKGEFELL